MYVCTNLVLEPTECKSRDSTERGVPSDDHQPDDYPYMMLFFHTQVVIININIIIITIFLDMMMSLENTSDMYVYVKRTLLEKLKYMMRERERRERETRKGERRDDSVLGVQFGVH